MTEWLSWMKLTLITTTALSVEAAWTSAGGCKSNDKNCMLGLRLLSMILLNEDIAFRLAALKGYLNKMYESTSRSSTHLQYWGLQRSLKIISKKRETLFHKLLAWVYRDLITKAPLVLYVWSSILVYYIQNIRFKVLNITSLHQDQDYITQLDPKHE